MESDPNYLALDAGNTRIKWGVHDGRGWLATGAILTANAADLGSALRGAPKAGRAIASNVAGEAVGAAIRDACNALGLSLEMIRASKTGGGVTNHYSEPTQLGSDRWAALVAAHHLSAANQLVVNAGTALTVDALTAEGEFLGGLIVPGPTLMRRSLDGGTAGLRSTEGAFQDFPRRTPDAITSGALQACAGAVARMREAMATKGMSVQRIVLSGGGAAELRPHLPAETVVRDNLVLDGLALIARER